MGMVLLMLCCFIILFVAAIVSIIAAKCFINGKLIIVAIVFSVAGIFSFFVLRKVINDAWD